MSNAQVVELLPRIAPRTLTLGESLILATFDVPGGLKAIVERIHEIVGPHYGTRNTFAKFLHADSYVNLSDKDRFRVWMIIATIGGDPQDFGASDAIVPPTFQIVDLRRRLLLPHLDSNQEPAGSMPAPIPLVPRRDRVSRTAGDAIITPLRKAN